MNGMEWNRRLTSYTKLQVVRSYKCALVRVHLWIWFNLFCESLWMLIELLWLNLSTVLVDRTSFVGLLPPPAAAAAVAALQRSVISGLLSNRRGLILQPLTDCVWMKFVAPHSIVFDPNTWIVYGRLIIPRKCYYFSNEDRLKCQRSNFLQTGRW